jgi:hypothetical protein
MAINREVFWWKSAIYEAIEPGGLTLKFLTEE